MVKLMSRRARFSFVTGLLLLSMSAWAIAGSRISNVILEIDSQGRGITEITNIGQEPLGYVVEALSWQVIDGEDRYEPTSDFMAVPPNFRLGPGQSRIVRVGFRKPQPQPVERAYRLAVQEVPPETGEAGVALVYRHLLAVFIAPAGGARPQSLEWSLSPGPGDDWRLRVTNTGNRRVSIRDVRVPQGKGEPVSVGSDRWSTVLAQTWRELRVPASLVNRAGVDLEVQYANASVKKVTVIPGTP